jgi:hypothetical protein
MARTLRHCPVRTAGSYRRQPIVLHVHKCIKSLEAYCMEETDVSRTSTAMVRMRRIILYADALYHEVVYVLDRRVQAQREGNGRGAQSTGPE